MQITGGVGEGQSAHEALEDLHAARDVVLPHGLGLTAAQAVDDRLQRLAVDVFHHEEVAPLGVHAHVVDGHDVGVLQAADGADLVDETGDDAGVLRLGEQPLHGDLAADVAVLDQGDLTHATAPEGAQGGVARAPGGGELHALAAQLHAGQHGISGRGGPGERAAGQRAPGQWAAGDGLGELHVRQGRGDGLAEVDVFGGRRGTFHGRVAPSGQRSAEAYQTAGHAAAQAKRKRFRPKSHTLAKWNSSASASTT